MDSKGAADGWGMDLLAHMHSPHLTQKASVPDMFEGSGKGFCCKTVVWKLWAPSCHLGYASGSPQGPPRILNKVEADGFCLCTGFPTGPRLGRGRRWESARVGTGMGHST